jgi:hypothetical protein
MPSRGMRYNAGMRSKIALTLAATAAVLLGTLLYVAPPAQVVIQPPTAALIEQEPAQTTTTPTLAPTEEAPTPGATEEPAPAAPSPPPAPAMPKPALLALPAAPIQGDPAMVVVENASATDIVSITFAGAPLAPFVYHGLATALIGFDLKRAAGTYPVAVKLVDGTTLKQNITFGERKHVVEPLGIPDKLGGNTTSSQEALVTTLAQENAELASLATAPSALFTEPFIWPLDSVTITDGYGYVRQTGAYEIAHKGADLRAAVGTRVYAANRGIIVLAKEFRNYGNTIVVDHGLGIQTFYMHLSAIDVAVGDAVARGQLIGKSGMTGYAEFPHLHLTVRIGGVSIDPEVFYTLLK